MEGVPLSALFPYALRKYTRNAAFHVNYCENCGLGGPIEFWTGAVANVFLGRHQLSFGIEGNMLAGESAPPISRPKMPLLYTLFFGESTDLDPRLWTCFNITIGGLFDLFDAPLNGFRIGFGFNYLYLQLELYYDFYPFDQTKGYTSRLTLLFINESF